MPIEQIRQSVIVSITLGASAIYKDIDVSFIPDKVIFTGVSALNTSTSNSCLALLKSSLFDSKIFASVLIVPDDLGSAFQQVGSEYTLNKPVHGQHMFQVLKSETEGFDSCSGTVLLHFEFVKYKAKLIL